MRDLTSKQFETALEKRGFKSEGILGYYRLPSNPNVSVSVYNTGSSYRAQLSYLIRMDLKEAVK